MSVETRVVSRAELTREGNVATVRLLADRGPAVMSSPTLGQLTEITEALADDPGVRFVVFRGTGKVFVAGADIAEMSMFDEAQGHALAVHGQRVFDAIENLPQVTFAAINGHALGGGCELAMACSFRLMVAGAKIGQPEVRLGLIPGWGGTKRLPQLVPLNWALRMLYTGEPVSAEQAEKIGLVDEVVASADGLDACLQKWFAMLTPGGRHTIPRLKRAILNDDEANQFGLCFNCSEAREGMQAFLEKRAPKWTDAPCP